MDRISRYRVARLALHIPFHAGAKANYALHIVGVKNGIPTASVLCDGQVHCPPWNPTTEEILEAMDAAIRQSMI